MVRRRSTVRFRNGAPGGLHVSAGSVCLRLELGPPRSCRGLDQGRRNRRLRGDVPRNCIWGLGCVGWPRLTCRWTQNLAVFAQESQNVKTSPAQRGLRASFFMPPGLAPELRCVGRIGRLRGRGRRAGLVVSVVCLAEDLGVPRIGPPALYSGNSPAPAKLHRMRRSRMPRVATRAELPVGNQLRQDDLS
jgi:hypothetical protein